MYSQRQEKKTDRVNINLKCIKFIRIVPPVCTVNDKKKKLDRANINLKCIKFIRIVTQHLLLYANPPVCIVNGKKKTTQSNYQSEMYHIH